MKRLMPLFAALFLLLSICMAAGCAANGVPDEAEPTVLTLAPTLELSVEDNTGDADNTEPAESVGTERTERTAPVDMTTAPASPTEPVRPPSSIDGITVPEGIETVDFLGRTFTILCDNGDATYKAAYSDFYSDGTDLVSVAVEKRNEAIERLHNCEIKTVLSAEPSSAILNDVAGNINRVELYQGRLKSRQNGIDLNLLTLEIDPLAPWWDQKWIGAMAAKDKNGISVLHGMVGDFSVHAMSSLYAVMYNKTVYEASGLADLYGDLSELALDDRWTMDTYEEMLKLAAIGGKIYGSLGSIRKSDARQIATHSLFAASGLSLVQNEDGVLRFADGEIDEWISVAEKAATVRDAELALPSFFEASYLNCADLLGDGKVLFVIDQLGQGEHLDGAGNYGILPLPKYGRDRSYHTFADNSAIAVSVPRTVTDPETVGDFLTLLGAYSRQTVRPAFEDACRTAYAADGHTEEMLRIIIDSRYYDFCNIMWNFKQNEFNEMMLTRNADVPKWFQRNEGIFSMEIQTYVQNISK